MADRPDFLNLIRAGALAFFALAHMQDVSALLAPASLALVMVAYSSDLVAYRRLPHEFALILLFLAFLAAVIFINGSYKDKSPIDIIKEPARVAYMLTVVVLFAHIRPTVPVETILFRMAMPVAALLSTLCLFDLFVKPLVIAGEPLSMVGTSGRLMVGLMGSHSAVANSYGTTLIFAIAAWLHGLRGRAPTLLTPSSILMTLVVMAGFVMAKSRGYLLGVGAVAVLVGAAVTVLRPRWRLAMAGLVLLTGLAGAFVVLSRDAKRSGENVDVRLVLWQRAAVLIPQSPWIGVGPGSFAELNVRYKPLIPGVAMVRGAGRVAEHPDYMNPFGGIHPHNSFLQGLLDWGILGFSIYGLLIWQGLRRARYVESRLASSPPPGAGREILEYAGWNGTVFAMSLVYMLVGGLSDGYVFIGPVSTFYLAPCFGRLIAQVEFVRWAYPARRRPEASWQT